MRTLVWSRRPSSLVPRPSSLPVRLPSGGLLVISKRSCNGCGRQLGDLTLAELTAIREGLQAPDVRAECGCGT